MMMKRSLRSRFSRSPIIHSDLYIGRKYYNMNKLLFTLFVCAFLCSCTDTDRATSKVNPVGESVETDVLSHADWAKNATIYEVNVRQHTEQGTFAAFEKDIPRIHDMGIDILWLMPIHPIGKKNRKGGLGSYYSVKDYFDVNPEYGDMSDLQNLVQTAHSYGMKVIIDWVANHSAWDCEWVEIHPEFYTLNEEGEMHAPVADWADVVDLSYDDAGLRTEMIKALKFWVEVADIDGYRCDVAEWVPTDFWEEARAELETVKSDIFMLAEAERPEHHERAFDMSYSWEFMHIMNEVSKGNKGLADIDAYMAKEDTNFVKDAYRMMFTTNHDENSWNGTVFERYGNAHELFATLAFTINGMPLVYGGQEAGNNRRLMFFEKDTVSWGTYEFQDFYSKLLHLNQSEPALWNGMHGGDYKRIATANDEEIFAYSRTKDDSQVIVLLNFADDAHAVEFKEAISGEYTSIFNGQTLSVFNDSDIKLAPYGYQVFVK